MRGAPSGAAPTSISMSVATEALEGPERLHVCVLYVLVCVF